MSNIGLLRKLGVYIEEEFLSAELCAALRLQMAAAPRVAAGLYNPEEDTYLSDSRQRQTFYSSPDATLCAQITTKIQALKPTLEAHFGDTYSDSIEGPKFLLYQTEHFFAAHTDDQLGRKINMTIFLNDEQTTPQPAAYVGGTLKLYGLIDHPQWQSKGISVPGQTGLLVAYPVDVVHEVTPIEAGERYAIVSRLLAPESQLTT